MGKWSEISPYKKKGWNNSTSNWFLGPPWKKVMHDICHQNILISAMQNNGWAESNWTRQNSRALLGPVLAIFWGLQDNKWSKLKCGGLTPAKGTWKKNISIWHFLPYPYRSWPTGKTENGFMEAKGTYICVNSEPVMKGSKKSSENMTIDS